MAQSAASQPFNLPVAPVAGFNQDQQQAFQQYRDLQGQAQPYYNQAQGLLQSSANPLTANDINQYYNPMASNVLANLHESQGQQMNDVTGKLTQTAGGVGASRIAVGQSELARQQQLAEGQTLSGLYQNALGAAQQNKQMQGNAAYGLTNLGTTAQGAALQGAGALFGAGQTQQQQQQQQLNAPYQNQLAQLAYPFQTAQYLAGITGGLSGAMGGTTTGQGQTTTPAPSLLSQLIGGGTAAVGGLGASGAFGNNGWLGNAMGTNEAYGNGNGEYGGSSSNPLPTLSPSDYGAGFAAGGAAGSPLGNPDWMGADPTVPQVEVHSQANPGAHLDLNPKPASSGSGGPNPMDIAKMAMMFINRGGRIPSRAEGGAVNPANPFQHFADGGELDFNDRFAGTDALPDFGDRFGDASGMAQPDRGTALAHYLRSPEASQVAPQELARSQAEFANPNPVVNPNDPVRMPDQASVQAWRNSVDNPAGANLKQAVSDDPGSLPPNAKPTQGPPPMAAPQAQASDYAAMRNPVPFPDIGPEQDQSRQFSKSPWLALINAGAAMMSGTSPFAGVNIGKGLQAGVKTLEDQRKQTTEEAGVNERAKQLIQAAEFHLDQYNKMTPKEQADVLDRKEQRNIQKEQANLKGWVAGVENPVSGEKSWIKPQTGEIRILKADGTIVSGNINDPSSFQKTTTTDGVDKESKLPKAEQPPPPMGQPELASDLKPPDGAVNTSMYRLKSAALTQANAEMKAVTALQTKEATNMGAQKLLIDNSKQAFGTLMKDRDQDGFLTKLATMRGNNIEERIRYARSLNEGLVASGKPPAVNPQKLAAMEVISKDQNTLGMLFASNLSSREAFAGQQVGIASTPGLTQSPLGMLRLIAGYDAQHQYTTDKHAFFNNYIQKYGVATGWQQAFEKQNPPERYIVRSMMENLPNRRAAEKLPEAVKILRENKTNPDVVKGFNKEYGNTASYWLTGKLDLLGAQ
jgi:hypothetical protein